MLFQDAAFFHGKVWVWGSLLVIVMGIFEKSWHDFAFRRLAVSWKKLQERCHQM